MTQRNVYSVEVTSMPQTWMEPSGAWVLLNPDENPWADQIDISLNLLLRRTLSQLNRTPERKNSGLEAESPLLIATPPGHPAPCVLVVCEKSQPEGVKKIVSLASDLGVRTVTVFPPPSWAPPKTGAFGSKEASAAGAKNSSEATLHLLWVE